MRVPRVQISLQWLMVLNVFAAIFICAAIELGPDLARRWTICRDKATQCAALARNESTLVAWFRALGRTQDADWAQHNVEYYRNEERRYRRALFIPWQFYTIGANIVSAP